jgi:integrase
VKADLTDRYIRTLPPQPKQVDIYDADVTGLSLRVGTSGKKHWYIGYRYQGKNRRMKIGSYPAMGLADARVTAGAHLLKAMTGKDPIVEQEREARNTFPALAEAYKAWSKSHKRIWRQDFRIIDKHLLPAWQKKKLTDVSRRDVRELIASIRDGDPDATPPRRPAPIMSNRILALASSMLSRAMRDDLITANPCALQDRAKEVERDRVLSPIELKALWSALEAEPPRMAAIIKLALLTAQRRSEVIGLRWAEIDDIDSPAPWWTLPASRSKNGKSHRVPLTGQALTILRALRAETAPHAVFVFPGRDGATAPLKGDWFLIERLRKRSGLEFRLHDLRRTAASLMSGIGVQRLVISKLLNHTEAGITRIYDRHSYDGDKRGALIRWDERVREIVSGGTPSKVVSISG